MFGKDGSSVSRITRSWPIMAMRTTFSSIKPQLLLSRLTPIRKSALLLSSPFVAAAIFCSVPQFFSPLLFPKARPFSLDQRRSFVAMSKPSADQIARDYETPVLRNPRKVAKKMLSKEMQEGVGATVRRSIGRPELKNFDPFLLLDDFAVSHPAGFPDHPHRGFETVTYMLEGYFTHEDFTGHKGTINAGDLQWMTAGRGIVHSELPSRHGVQKGLQLWVNLSSKNKMVDPNWQELQSKDIVRVKRDGVDVRIIAGQAFGVTSPIYTLTPTMYLDFTMDPGAELRQLVPEDWNAFVYVMGGDGVFGDEDAAPVSGQNLLILSKGDGLRAWNKSGRPLRFVLVGGQPLNEPVVQYGPFVMNTRAEIEQAFEDYHLGKNGFEKAREFSARRERN